MSLLITAVVAAVIAAAVVAMSPTRAEAVATPVPLGTAGNFGVLAGSTVTNTGPTTVERNVGVSPGTAVVGFPPGAVVPPGTIHAANSVALQAQNDLTTAYNQAAGQAPDVTYTGDPVELGGQTLVPGVYKVPVSAQLTGTLTLNGQGNPNAVWVFQVGSTLTTASASEVLFTNGANPCNVYWQIGSSATLGTGTRFVGNVLALSSITANTNTTVNGRLLARNGAVTLDSNTIFQGECGTSPTGTASPTPTGTASPTPTGTASPTPTGTASPTPTGTASPTPTGTASPTPTGTASPTPTGTASPTPTGTASPTPTGTASPTPTGTASPTATASPTDGGHHEGNGHHDEGKKHEGNDHHDEGKKHEGNDHHDEGKKHEGNGHHDEGKKHDEHDSHGWADVPSWSGR
ncbi:ice-binding family protein [Streptomyces massasporeus]|uniref:ice-binding family protein n=1 Tax=Streptomyces massasporeus TaxID=67324 RepID=UPI001676881A|nr:ice-binding family protein [Streptomyces massasporeus]GGV72883.1 hypothetical protein GCM10010228_33070 [Streptomyces massasporeus]